MAASSYFRRNLSSRRWAVRAPAVLSSGQVASLANPGSYTVEQFFRQAAFTNPTVSYTGMSTRQLLVAGQGNSGLSWYVELRIAANGSANLFFYNVQAATAGGGAGEHLIATQLPLQARHHLRVAYDHAALTVTIEVNNVVVLTLPLTTALYHVNVFTWCHTPGNNTARAFYGDLEEPRIIATILSQAVKDATWNQYNADIANITSYAGAWDFKALAIGAAVSYLDLSGKGQSLTNTSNLDLRVTAGSNF